MLDAANSEPEVTEAEPEAQPELEPEAQAEETPEIVIQIEGEEPEPDPDAEIEAELGDKGRHALKAAREAAKQARAEARELKAKLAEQEASKAPQVDEIGPRPVIADYGFDDDKHAAALIEWHEKKRQQDARKAEEQSAQKAREAAYDAKLKAYHADRQKVGVDDEVQAVVVAKLNAQQQAALMDASGDPAKVVAALAKTPKILEELSGIKEIHRFTYRLAQIEGKITMTTKAPPPPETKLRGTAAATSTFSAGDLEKLRAKAEETGDYSAYFRAKAAAKARA
jgi:hypothetical protein